MSVLSHTDDYSPLVVTTASFVLISGMKICSYTCDILGSSVNCFRGQDGNIIRSSFENTTFKQLPLTCRKILAEWHSRRSGRS